jgi:heme/copper-type cytochrome/quinol oxidase subunit 3
LNSCSRVFTSSSGFVSEEEEEAEEEKGAKLKNLLFLAVFLAFLFVVLHVGSFLITPAATTDSADDASAER